MGVLIGMAFLAYAASRDPSTLARLGITPSQMAGVYIGGGTLSGLIGGALWPYQRTRLETLVFAIPTSIPVYLLAGLATGGSLVGVVVAALLGGTAYSLLYGGRHGANGSNIANHR